VTVFGNIRAHLEDSNDIVLFIQQGSRREVELVIRLFHRILVVCGTSQQRQYQTQVISQLSLTFRMKCSGTCRSPKHWQRKLIDIISTRISHNNDEPAFAAIDGEVD
jgi:hypothetical protein